MEALTRLATGTMTAVPHLQHVMEEIVEKIYRPHYKNSTVLVHAGNTDGWFKAAMMLCNPGEGVLVSEWTFPTALAVSQISMCSTDNDSRHVQTLLPMDVTAIPVAMDHQGMRSDALRTVLIEWDEVVRCIPRSV